MHYVSHPHSGYRGKFFEFKILARHQRRLRSVTITYPVPRVVSHLSLFLHGRLNRHCHGSREHSEALHFPFTIHFDRKYIIMLKENYLKRISVENNQIIETETSYDSYRIIHISFSQQFSMLFKIIPFPFSVTWLLTLTDLLLNLAMFNIHAEGYMKYLD